ncbi:hypothetical protein HIM_02803 [Hirsutella minnesotensis 3608]|nr:hypothetical protein HIM_02803 [Hirsutella minnesotensis 3608]
MSFLSERLFRGACPAARALSAHGRTRMFSSTAALCKSPTETVKDGLKSVDRAVSDNVVLPGLDAAAKAKDATQNMTKRDVKGKAEQVKGQAKGAANQAAGTAQGTASEMAGKAKGTAEEIKSKM